LFLFDIFVIIILYIYFL